MKNNFHTNLHTLYNADFRHLSETILRNLETTEEIQQLRQTVKANIPGSNWSLLRSEILAQTQQLLEIDLYPILITSWESHQDVAREMGTLKRLLKADPKNDTTTIVDLDEHEIKSTYSPSLSIRIGEKIHLLRSFIAVTFNLKGVSLKIQRGEITKILSGDLSGKGFMQYQNATLIEKDFLTFSLTGLTASPAIEPITQDSPVVTLTHNNPQNSNQPILTSPPQKTSASTNMIQFFLGISLALLAIFLFWQLK